MEQDREGQGGTETDRGTERKGLYYKLCISIVISVMCTFMLLYVYY